jgi:hypothetical protein
LLFKDVTIDHLLPESLELAEKAKAIAEYGLAIDFDINDFPNWVPAHGVCNSSKGGRLFAPSAAMVKAFDDARRRGDRARTIAAGLERDRAKARVLTIVDQANAKGVVNRDDVMAVFSIAGGAPASGSIDVKVTAYKVSSAFTVFRSEFDSYAFSDSGIMVTHPGGPPFKAPATCPHCGAAWSWHGNVCGACNWAIVAY